MTSTHRIAGPDRAVATDVTDRAPVPRAASLEQLRRCARELEGGVFLVDAAGSRCVLDVRRRRFGRARPALDEDVIALVGRWHPYDGLFCDGEDLIVVPSAGAVRLRIRADPRAA
jgi:hypothetical protein